MKKSMRAAVTHDSSAVSVEASTVPTLGTGPGASPRTALPSLWIAPIPFVFAKQMVTNMHYLHSMPGGTQLTFGVYAGVYPRGVITIGVGPKNAHSLVEGAKPQDCATLTRLWLSDELPPNSESRVIGYLLRALRRDTDLKFLLSYADPSQGHVGTIYQATNWLYTGRSGAMPLYDLGDGIPRHSRSLAQTYGTHSKKHFEANGIEVRTIPQEAKYRYLIFLDQSWRFRLRVPILPYPKKGDAQ